jgi:hypothetical protein
MDLLHWIPVGDEPPPQPDLVTAEKKAVISGQSRLVQRFDRRGPEFCLTSSL